METPLFRLADVGSADPCRLLYDLSDLLLRPLLYGLELAYHSFQPITTHFLALAQVLGIAICRGINNLVPCDGCDDYLGTCVGGLEPYPNGRSVDNNRDKAIYR